MFMFHKVVLGLLLFLFYDQSIVYDWYDLYGYCHSIGVVTIIALAWLLFQHGCGYCYNVGVVGILLQRWYG